MKGKSGLFSSAASVAVLCALALLGYGMLAGAQGASELDTLVPIEEEEGREGAKPETTSPAEEGGEKGEALGPAETQLETELKAAEEPRKEEVLSHPTKTGFSGLVHITSADSGDPWSWAVGLNSGFFIKNNFIHSAERSSDENRYVSGIASFRFSIWKYFEAAIALESFANYNKYSIAGDTQTEPELFQTLGETSLGVRGFYPPLRWFYLGLGYRIILHNKIGKVGVGAASHELMLPLTFDIKKINSRVPLRIHINAAYLFDESANLVEEAEAMRAGEGPTCEVTPEGDYNHLACISPVERFALRINRVDQFKVGLGLDVPVPYVNPFLEWNLGIPVNRQGFTCGERMNEFTGDDSCLLNEGFAAFPQNITIGLRARGIPYGPLKGLGLLAAADIGLTGMKAKNRVREIAMNPPYMIYLGISYTPAVKPKDVVKVQEVVRTEIKEPPPKPKIIGRVIDAETKSPIEGAVVTFSGRDLTGLVTGRMGTFTSYPLEKGEYEMTLTAQGYFDSTCSASLPEVGDVEVECVMRPMPKLAEISGQVLDSEKNVPLSGVTVRLSGPREKSLTTDASGTFTLETTAGRYDVKVELEGYFSKAQTVNAPAGGSVNLQFMLSKKPKKALAVIKKKQIRIGKKIQFEFDTATIKPVSYVVLDSVADVILKHPEIQLVEIQGHTDDRGTDAYNMQLSQERANSVRDYLISAGVEPERLVAKGYGESKPIAPNVTAAGREKNRRVEFHIISQAGAE